MIYLYGLLGEYMSLLIHCNIVIISTMVEIYINTLMTTFLLEFFQIISL